MYSKNFVTKIRKYVTSTQKYETHFNACLKAFSEFRKTKNKRLTSCNQDIATIKDNWCVPRTRQLVTNLLYN